MSDVASVRPLRTAEWVGARLGISRWQVYELAKRAALPHVKLGRLVRFDEDAIEAFIGAGGTSGAAPSQAGSAAASRSAQSPLLALTTRPRRPSASHPSSKL
jgi:excisionase family DNA binding protein